MNRANRPSYSVLFYQEKAGESALTLLDRLSNLLGAETDGEVAYRHMVALGTLLHIGGEVKEAGLNVYDAKKVVKAAGTRIKDPRLDNVGAEVAAI